ncbi:RNase A-like domain-containing protein, partial [Streptomyces beihaiensis]
AALDAAAARTAADQAEAAAKAARQAADQADADATAAEKAAKDAQKYAKQAQEAAEQAENAQKNKQIKDGAGGIGGLFYTSRNVPVGDPTNVKKHNCNPIFHTGNCTVTATIHFRVDLDIYLCTAQDVPATQAGCPMSDTYFLGTTPGKEIQSKTVTRTLTMVEFNKGIDPVKILLGDFIECGKKIASLVSDTSGGTWGDCAWAAFDIGSIVFGGKVAKAVADALKAVDASLRTGIGVKDALQALKAIDGVNPATVAEAEKTVDAYEEATTACSTNSFPGSTRVLLANGTRRAIRDVHIGDLLMAGDPTTGRLRGEQVTRDFRHQTVVLEDITLARGGRLTSTPGHRVFVMGRGWTLASALHKGDRLRTPTGSFRTVAAVRQHREQAPRTVYDLTVSGLHTFYAFAGVSPVLVHNCDNLELDEKQFPDAHTLEEHVRPDEQKAKALSARKTREQGRPTPNSVWTDQETAQKVLDAVLKDKASQISTWMTRKPNETVLELKGYYGPKGTSLGKVYWADKPTEAAGNGFLLKLVKAPRKPGMPKHPKGFYVQTFFPR